jgi:hypothetical protein
MYRFFRSLSFSLFQVNTLLEIVQNIFYSCIIENPTCLYEDAINFFKTEVHNIYYNKIRLCNFFNYINVLIIL